MFDIGWSEMAVVAVVALVVIGPKDLPRLLRQVGEWTGKARALAREFQGHMDELARQSELDDLKKQAEKVTGFDMKEEIANTIDPGGDLRRTVQEAGQAADPNQLIGNEPAPGIDPAPATDAPAIETPAIEGPRPQEQKA
ncbi:Sec-independent protein translocase protein TatB [Desertibaculum subflavum]|uniref:Sec-independent protein translocase protein TatB n=1 Tax=Desertibaculum subflavum TaxID=2268458 RepID=UPI000E66A974